MMSRDLSREAAIEEEEAVDKAPPAAAPRSDFDTALTDTIRGLSSSHTLIKDIKVDDVEDGLPALLTMILMPLTFNITVGIGAGFIAWVFIKVVKGKWADVHWLMWLVAGAFVIYFLTGWLTGLISPAPAG